jgi:hypothetical protein
MTAQEKLVEAEAAYHQLLTGSKARVVVDQNGERIEFTATTRGALAAYIEQLKNEIAGNTKASQPLRVWF